jgi:hypothetical protein
MATLIYYNESGYNQALSAAGYVTPKLTDLVSQFAALGFANAAPVATSDLPPLVADPEAWLLARFLGNGPLLLGGLPVNVQKALEIVEKPVGFDAFIKSAKEARGWLEGPQMFGLLRDAASYAVAGNGTVSLATTAQQALQASFKYYTATAAQDALLTDLLALCDILNRQRAGVLSGSELVTGGRLTDALIFPMHSSPSPVRPNPQFILTYAR